MPSTVGIVASGVQGFSPLDLSPVLWLDASDTTTITASGGKVSQWNDKSTSGYNVSQATSALQPSTKTLGSGKNVLSFSSCSLTYSTSNLGRNITGATVYVVHYPTSLATQRYPISISIPGNDLNRIFLGVGFVASQMFAGGRTLDADSLVRVDSSNKSANAWYVQVAVFDYANKRLDQYINGSSDGSTSSFQTATTTSDTQSSKFAIGAFADGTNNAYLGDIAEVVMFHSAHNADQRAAMTNYLNGKWAVY